MEPLKGPESLNGRPRLCFHESVSVSGGGGDACQLIARPQRGEKRKRGMEGKKGKGERAEV